MRYIFSILCVIFMTCFLSGCIWGTVAVVSVAVVSANVDEYQQSSKVRNSTEALDEHLAHEKKVDEAMKCKSEDQLEPIDSDEVIETYGGKILTD